MRAGVVDVVLAVDLVTDKTQQAPERVAVDRVAGAANVNRAGRVGADKLNVDLKRWIGDGASPALTSGNYSVNCAVVPVVREDEVDETGAGDLSAD